MISWQGAPAVEMLLGSVVGGPQTTVFRTIVRVSGPARLADPARFWALIGGVNDDPAGPFAVGTLRVDGLRERRPDGAREMVRVVEMIHDPAGHDDGHPVPADDFAAVFRGSSLAAAYPDEAGADDETSAPEDADTSGPEAVRRALSLADAAGVLEGMRARRATDEPGDGFPALEGPETGTDEPC